MERQGEVDTGLAAHGGQEGVRPLALEDLFDDLGDQRLDVGRVGESGSVMIVAGLELTRTTR